MKICPSCNGKYEDHIKKCPACSAFLHDVSDNGRYCKRCGRVLEADEITCRACRERDKFKTIALKDDFSKEKYTDPALQKHNYLPGVLAIVGIVILIAFVFVRPVVIVSFGDGETVTIPIGSKVPAPQAVKPAKKITGEKLEFAFGTSSSDIDKQLDNYNYSYAINDDQIVMASDNNKISIRLSGLDIGRCVTITNWGECGGFDELTFYDYPLYGIEYSCLKKTSGGKILDSDGLTLILFQLNVIDKAATYHDLKTIFTKKHGECSFEDIDEERQTGHAVWILEDNTLIILENDSYNVKVQHSTADAYEWEQRLRSIREAEALEQENAIRENRDQ